MDVKSLCKGNQRRWYNIYEETRKRREVTSLQQVICSCATGGGNLIQCPWLGFYQDDKNKSCSALPHFCNTLR